MLEIREPKDFKEIYDYQMGMTFPYRFLVNFDIWKKSFLEDTDGEGRSLLKEAMDELEAAHRVYAFFHYFGMNCFARHGKLFETYPWIENDLREYGFTVEHENVYYSAIIQSGSERNCTDEQESEIRLVEHELTKGNHQAFDFMLGDRSIGGCEVHYLEARSIAYLRWIYLNDDMQNQGLGTKCMDCLKRYLVRKGCGRLETLICTA